MTPRGAPNKAGACLHAEDSLRNELDTLDCILRLRPVLEMDHPLAPELAALVDDIRDDVPYDLLGVRLETAAMQLSDITGESTPDDVLNAVFSKFCIGK